MTFTTTNAVRAMIRNSITVFTSRPYRIATAGNWDPSAAARAGRRINSKCLNSAPSISDPIGVRKSLTMELRALLSAALRTMRIATSTALHFTANALDSRRMFRATASFEGSRPKSMAGREHCHGRPAWRVHLDHRFPQAIPHLGRAAY